MSNGRRKTRCRGCGKTVDIPRYVMPFENYEVECLDCTGTPIYESIEYAYIYSLLSINDIARLGK